MTNSGTVLSLVSTSALAQDTTGVGAISGVVNAAGHGGFDTSWSDELKALLASFARPVDR